LSPKDSNLVVRLEPEEKKLIEEIAKEEGFKNVSDYVRFYSFGGGRNLRNDIKEILKKLNQEK
jgi:DNA-binding MarR family transcriptional regulator